QGLEEDLEEAEFRLLPVRPRGARGQIHRNHPQPAEARLDVAPLGVELAAVEATLELVRRAAAIEGDAAVAFLLGERVAGLERLQAVEPGVEVDLLALHLLQAHHVGTLRGEPAEQALFRRRADAVDVESDDPQDDGKAETPPCAADHCAGARRNFSTSPLCAASR